MADNGTGRSNKTLAEIMPMIEKALKVVLEEMEAFAIPPDADPGQVDAEEPGESDGDPEPAKEV